MKQILLYSTALLVIVFQTMSCGKKGSSASTCKIINGTATEGSTQATYNITYNNEGKISVLQTVSGSTTNNKVFTYQGDVINIQSSDVGSTDVTVDSVVVNSDGLMITDVNTTGSDVTRSTYNYSGTQLVSVVSEMNNGTPYTNLYSFNSAGDATNINGQTFAYNDKPSQAGDYLQFSQLVQFGAPFIKTTHQCISDVNGTQITDFSYTYDSSGKITQMVVTSGGQVITYNYAYECN